MAAHRQKRKKFSFEISLSVLNHLGRNLYRNFITVLGEAISNSWDADAKNVWIEIDRDSNVFSIKDDGVGMDATDFQTKFLKIGYSKRSEGKMRTRTKRPFIGAKGIGKLALLSCAKRISVFTKKKGQAYVGGVIDNSGLDDAIKSDLTPEKYPLDSLDFGLITSLKKGHKRGTIIVFEESKDQIRNSINQIRKMLALNFRFSIIDKNFSIFVNGEEVTIHDLQDLLDATQFAWTINEYEDDFVSSLDELKKQFVLSTPLDIRGFIASVKRPANLKITGTDERATIDLFVNGRLREKNILRHIPTQRIVESYIYGQIHFDSMDSPGKDPFTSSREGVVEDDSNFQSLLDYLKREALPTIFDDWDKGRLNRGEEGDEENTARKSKKDRKARDLYSAAREDYAPDKDAPAKDQVDAWLTGLRDDAEFNLASYADCFLAENLVRKYIDANGISFAPSDLANALKWRKAESTNKGKANISFEIRKNDDDASYLGMNELAFAVEGNKGHSTQQSLWTDAVAFAPVRNVVGHTGLLTDNAKQHLRLTYENIKARVKKLVSQKAK